MSRRVRAAGVTGLVLVAVTALVVVAGGAASPAAVSEVGFAAPGEADRLRLEPAGFPRREEGGSGHRGEGDRCDRQRL